VDASGNPAIDPTANVLQLVDAAIKRQDDLRDVKIYYVEKIADIRSAWAKDRAEQHAISDREMHEMERAAGLRTAASIEAVRAQFEGVLNSISNRISILEQTSYQSVGRQEVKDPMIAQLLEEVKTLRSSSETGIGKREGMSESFKMIVSLVTVAVALITIGSFVFLSHGTPAPSPVYYTPVAPGTLVPSPKQ
jgi:hypothetical protein